MSAMVQLLPMMEVVYNRKKATYFKMAHSNLRGTHVVAVNHIQAGAVVLIEKALHIQPTKNHPSLSVDPEYQSLIGILDGGSTSAASSTCSSTAHKDAVGRLAELNATAYVQGSKQKDEIWQLEDSHRQARVGDTVKIHGLASEAGKKLNGKYGEISKKDEKDENRFGVMVAMGAKNNKKSKSKSVLRSIKPCNLKTLGGIMRTNAYHDGSLEANLLFKELCRINHACGDAANVNRTIHQGKVYVVAKRDIADGEELLIDYLPLATELGRDRLELLHNMFNFWCQCSEHQQLA
ncbi:expressed unknown protein [Seminavis robusta]|uniref:SET domain-containing protein n=1 Tax=Seminavis robusta TaxID=568900 RepID=A0A9N8HZJ8_9STRA|nr:expressed unknown protein [Seminavis robusta]|eukprot:Sro2302_g322520.1 n/a (293) ;mRNA; r:14623-15501